MRTGNFVRSGLFAAIGLILVLVSKELIPFWKAALHEIGFALMISVIVWLMFENQLSREADGVWDSRIERMTKNVFQAVLRKDLPKGLLDEANNLVLNSSLIRRGFSVTYTLMDSAYSDTHSQMTPCVLVEAVMEFSMENVSTDNACWNVGLGLPNPIHPGLKALVEVKSVIVSKGGDEVTLDLETAHREFQDALHQDSQTSVPFKAGEIEVKPGEKYEFSASYVMAKETEDSELLQTRFPSEGLRITIFDKAQDDRRLVFARSVHRHPLESASEKLSVTSSKIFTVPGYLLPHQGVLIWWKRNPLNLSMGLNVHNVALPPPLEGDNASAT
jgi:hypothetical protein